MQTLQLYHDIHAHRVHSVPNKGRLEGKLEILAFNYIENRKYENCTGKHSNKKLITVKIYI